jgi:DNA-binding transcriptional regulator YiaG
MCPVRFTSSADQWQCRVVPRAVATSPIRALRIARGLSQREFAAALGVSLESYRPWDAGRRHAPDDVLDRARCAVTRECDMPMPLSALARTLRISKGTLRAAALDGRLAVTTQAPGSGKPMLVATRKAGKIFKRTFYEKTTKFTTRPPAPDLVASAPDDFDRHLVALRERLRVSQSELARRIGAAGKAVVYQWESRQRKPSSILWRRVMTLDSRVPGALR